MNRERKKGITYSVALHLFVFLLSVFGLPLLMEDKFPDEPVAVTVEILPIADKSNVRPSPEPPAEKEEPKKQEAPKQPKPPEPPRPEAKKEEKKPTPPAKSEPPPPEPKKEEKPDAPKEEKKPEPKPEEKKPEPKKEDKKKKTKEQDELDAVLENLKTDLGKTHPEESKEDAKEQKAASKKRSQSTSFDPNAPETLSVIDAISAQIKTCWRLPTGVRNAHELVVHVHIEYNQDGSFKTVSLTGESAAKAQADPAFRAAADTAMRAVRMCSPLKNMPADKYHIWDEVDMEFDPQKMLY